MKRPIVTITLDDVLDKYWQLANLNTEETKGTISGQLKALDSLCEQLSARSGKPAAVPQRPEGLYRPAWLVTEPHLEN